MGSNKSEGASKSTTPADPTKKTDDISITTGSSNPAANPTPASTTDSPEEASSKDEQDPEAGKPTDLLEKSIFDAIDVSGNWIELSNSMVDDVAKGSAQAGQFVTNLVAKRWEEEYKNITPEGIQKLAEENSASRLMKDAILKIVHPELQARIAKDIQEHKNVVEQRDKWNERPADQKTPEDFNKLSSKTQNMLMNSDKAQEEIQEHITGSKDKASLSPEASKGLEKMDAEKEALTAATKAKLEAMENRANATNPDDIKAADKAVTKATTAESDAQTAVNNSNSKLEQAQERIDTRKAINNEMADFLGKNQPLDDVKNNKDLSQGARDGLVQVHAEREAVTQAIATVDELSTKQSEMTPKIEAAELKEKIALDMLEVAKARKSTEEKALQISPQEYSELNKRVAAAEDAVAIAKEETTKAKGELANITQALNGSIQTLDTAEKTVDTTMRQIQEGTFSAKNTSPKSQGSVAQTKPENASTANQSSPQSAEPSAITLTPHANSGELLRGQALRDVINSGGDGMHAVTGNRSANSDKSNSKDNSNSRSTSPSPSGPR